MKRYVPVLMILAAGGIAMAANVIISPNMGMPVPVVGTAPGPDWANDINASLSIIDSHDHTAGHGVQVPPAGLNINSDLTFQDNSATNLKTTSYTVQGSPLSGGTFPGALYVSGVDLYYNDISGNQVRMTTGGNVNAGAGSITGLPSGTASASFAASTFTFQSATNTPANMAVGPLIIGTNTASPHTVTVAPPGGLGANYNLTLPSAVPGATSLMQSDTSGNLSFTTTPTLTGGALSGTFSGNPIFGGNVQFTATIVDPLVLAGSHATGIGTKETFSNTSTGSTLVISSGSGDTYPRINSNDPANAFDIFTNNSLHFEVGSGGSAITFGSHATGSGTQLQANNTSTGQVTVIDSGSGNTSPSIATTTADDLVIKPNNSEVLRAKSGGGVAITGALTTGAVTISGTGGNTPHGCTIRDHSCSATTTCTSTCSAGEIVTGGGCSMLSGYRDSLSGSTSSWQCISTGTTNIVAEAICCSI